MVAVAITRDEASIERAIEEALGHVPLAEVVRGKRVAVKPNETYADEHDASGVTQPDTLRAVLRAVKRHAPRELVVTGGSGAAPTTKVLRAAGLDRVLDDEGVELVDHNQPPFVEVSLEYGPDPEVHGPQRRVMINPRVLEYEALIVVSQLKLHETATVTLALKNVAMSFPAAGFYGYPRSTKEHDNSFFDDMHSFIAAMHRRFPIHLAVTVGHPAMLATGPLGGHTVETGLVIASTDALAADVVGARLLGFEVQAVRHLWEAQKLGLGETDTDRMEFPAMGLKDAIKAFTRAAYGVELTFEHE
ncbi:MAG: DUF362 domain-containing protein [Planctomycetes bacterium]|nr:DUF362 domain-containing protein [Planctomycetota bacterium]